MVHFKTLIITSCTGEKKFKPENQLLQADFQACDNLSIKEKQLEEYMVTAGDMYTGMQHLRLMEGVKILRDKYGSDVVDVNIVSAGYGLISENRRIAPYEVTFNTMSPKEIVAWSKTLRIKESLSTAIKGYDLILFLLGDKYLRALELPVLTSGDQRLIFFASGTSRKLIPNEPNYFIYEVGQKDAKSFSYGLVALKGYLFKLLAQDLVLNGTGLISQIKDSPDMLSSILDKYRKVPLEQESLFAIEEIAKGVATEKKILPKEKVPTSYVSDAPRAKNYGISMRYFIPEWDDRVDPTYNFIKDESTEGRNPYLHDVYSHEIFDTPNYDGVLISKVKIEESNIKKARVQAVGVHDFIRYPNSKPIMGDCGAFGYITDEEPPYTTEEILDYYEDLGFTQGVSIDHLIVGDFAKDPVERKRRYDITRRNAADFIQKWQTGNFSFEPVGVAQGWDPQSYLESVGELIDMGYKFIALGGVARTPTKQILEILNKVVPIIPDYLQFHLFGVARLDAIPTFRKLGVTSFDSASHLRRAWLGSGSNYFAMDGKTYAAIRIPPVDGHGVRVKKMIEAGIGTKEEFKVLEVNALAALRGFDRGNVTLDDALEAVLTYDEKIGEGREKHADYYRRVLEDQPWKKCDCKICREIGIEVIIFRGNNRNRRRGFHNTYVFYNQFKKIF
ncbi:tRNA-guanine transglycosylase DpdA [Desulfosporosinus fructosivorans]|uniref:tRNA-guanine transglycosylase DpdA n=1 Tax=Desulfosporosinus fructosivorans TaxID=2018669 RepID=UPI0018EE8C83|nr:tRNA-guanine transglycosylase DpdA [Desulfosporosinus fructosivorans]